MNCLSSFVGASLSVDNGVFLFSGSKQVSNLFRFEFVERPQVMNYWVRFDVAYITALDLGFVDISFLEPLENDVIASDTVFAYPFECGNNYRDITFVLNDAIFRGSDFVNGNELKVENATELTKTHAHSVVSQAIFKEAVAGITFSYGDGSGPSDEIPFDVSNDIGGVIYPVIQTLQAISSFDQTVGFARSHFPIPDVILEPTDFVCYWLKMMLIESNFKNNINQDIPITNNSTDLTHIYNQNVKNINTVGHTLGDDDDGCAWAKWRFGFNNMKVCGCPVFATYNLLIDLGYQVNLAVLIAFFELANADLLWAVFGGCPLDEGTIDDIKNVIIASLIALGIGASFIPVVGTAFFFVSISSAVLVSIFADVCLSKQRGLGDVLDCLGLLCYSESFLSAPSLFSKFKTSMTTALMGIICFWNALDGNMNPDLSSGAHYVYVRRDLDENDPFCAYNVYCSYFNAYSLVNLSHLMSNDYDDQKAERATIAFYVV